MRNTLWTAQQFQSGSTVVGNGEMFLYFHTRPQIWGELQNLGMTDDEWNTLRQRYAADIADILNKAGYVAPSGKRELDKK